MKAFAITTIERGKDSIDAGSVFDCSAESFDRLEKNGAVRKPTENEIAIARSKGVTLDNDPGTVVKNSTADADQNKEPADLKTAAGLVAASEDETVDVAAWRAAAFEVLGEDAPATNARQATILKALKEKVAADAEDDDLGA